MSKHTEHTDEADRDLDWLAFRYVLGELDKHELSAFESRLADDQACREAVARAVELGTLGYRALDDHRPTVRPVPTPLVTAVAGLAVAASLAIALISSSLAPSWLTNGTTMAKPEDAESRAAETKRLAHAWLEAGDHLVELTEPEAAEWEEYLPDHEEYDSLSTSDDEGDLEAPEWMMAAVEGMCGFYIEGENQ